MKFLIYLILLITCSSQTYALTPAGELEISHLLQFIKNSNCTFNRNGKHYKSSEAYEHIHKKYDYLKQRNKIKSAENFIEYSATQSSISGIQYRVLCGEEHLYSDDWLYRELNRYRSHTNSPL